jgi:ABC-type polar amino acid transport system ATPase subunit
VNQKNTTKIRSFGELLALYMIHNPKNKQYSINELAMELKVNRVNITRWLSEDVKKPQCHTLKRIAELLDISNLEPKAQIEFCLSATGCEELPIDLDKIVRKSFTSTSIVEKEAKSQSPFDPYPIPGIPIVHPRQFFGQTEALKKIRWAWQSPSLRHIAVIGERRSGKTSLLKYLQTITQTPKMELRLDQPQSWNNWLPENFQLVEVNFQLATMCKPESLLKNILKQLNLDVPEPCDLIHFSELLKEKLNKPTIILMDEMGAGLQAPELDECFWQHIKGLAENHHKLGFVITAHEPIAKLATESNQGKSFSSIFADVSLKALTKDEARNLINSFSHSIAENDTVWILQNSDCHPALLQLICNERIYALEENDNSDTWKQEALQRIEPFLYLLNQ